MESLAVYMPLEQGEKMTKVWRSAVSKVILAACIGLMAMVIQRAPFFYEVPILMLAYILFGLGFSHPPLKRRAKGMLTRPELEARLSAFKRERIVLLALLAFVFPTLAYLASREQLAPFFLNILVGILLLTKLSRDIPEYEMSRIVPPPPEHLLRIYGILHRLELVPAYFPDDSGNGQKKGSCLELFVGMPDNLIRLANDIAKDDGFWNQEPQAIPPADIEGRRAFVQYVLKDDPGLSSFLAADTAWHTTPTTKTELRALLKQELNTPYYFLIS